MKRSTSASQAVSPSTGTAHMSRTGGNGEAEPSNASRIEDLETRLQGMLEAIDIQFQRIIDLRLQVKPVDRETRLE
jgi:hypothetical protein